MRKVIIVLVISALWAPLQAQFDAFKYVVIPVQFEAFREANQHKTSTLIKYFFDERGYPAIYDLGKPETLVKAPCQAVYTRLNDNSNLFLTRVSLSFVDCEGKIVFETQEGRSKVKDYKDAYKEALEQAFQSFNGMAYTYSPPAGAAREQGEVAEARELPPPPPSIPAPAESVRGTDTLENAADIWYAQPIENGFQLVDSSPRIRMKILRSSRENTFIAMVDGEAKGTVFEEDGAWIHEYVRKGEIVQERLNIKF